MIYMMFMVVTSSEPRKVQKWQQAVLSQRLQCTRHDRTVTVMCSIFLSHHVLPPSNLFNVITLWFLHKSIIHNFELLPCMLNIFDNLSLYEFNSF